VRPDTTRPARDPWIFYDAPVTSQLSIETVTALPGPLRRAGYVASAVARATAGGPDVVFTRDLGIADLLLRTNRRLRPPVVYESHGYAPAVAAELPRLLGTAMTPTPAKLLRLETRERRVWRRAEGYITLTRVHQQELEDRFDARPNTAVVPDGTRIADIRAFTAPAAGTSPLIVYAGHLYPWKGVDLLIDMLGSTSTFRVRIVGGQPGERDRERLEALAAERHVAGRVEFTGWMPPSQVAAELARADLLVLPNTQSHLSERYTSPLKLFEYLAAGRPIVASNLPALREVLTDNVNALLVSPGSADALGDACMRLATDPALASRLARQAFDDAAKYSWDVRATRIEAVLNGTRAGAV
jgi:glycosyltransferase involved in cell wall biosynthesis